MTKLHPESVVKLVNQLKYQTFQSYYIEILYDSNNEEGLDILKSIGYEYVNIQKYPYPNSFKVGNKWNYLLKKSLVLKPTYIYTLHDDMEICSPNLIEKLVEFLDNNKICGAVGPTIYNSEGTKTWGKGIVKTRMGKEYVINETYMVRAKCYLNMGLMNSKLHYYGTEYFTFNWLRENGYTCEVLDDVSIIHYAGSNKGTSTRFQNKKDYYRPRTSILVMKLFCKKDSFKKKLVYFYEELYEPRMKMKRFIKNLQLFSLARTWVILFVGTIVGLVTPIRFNKPYEVDESN